MVEDRDERRKSGWWVQDLKSWGFIIFQMAPEWLMEVNAASE